MIRRRRDRGVRQRASVGSSFKERVMGKRGEKSGKAIIFLENRPKAEEGQRGTNQGEREKPKSSQQGSGGTDEGRNLM